MSATASCRSTLYMRGRMNDVKPISRRSRSTADGRRRGRRSGRNPRIRLRVGDKVCTWPAGATKTVGPALAQQIARHRRRAQAIPRQTSADWRHGYFGLLEAASAKAATSCSCPPRRAQVGSAVVQIAKAKGMTVIGSAGGADRVRLRPLARRDAWSITRRRPAQAAVRRRPQGHDVYLDNVGGDHLDRRAGVAGPMRVRDLRNDRRL